MNKEYVLVGTGGLARELTAWLYYSGSSVRGYVTTAPEEHKAYNLPGEILDENCPVDTPAWIMSDQDDNDRRSVIDANNFGCRATACNTAGPTSPIPTT